MNTYTAYLPTGSHEPCPVATIDYYPTRNAAIVREAGQPEREYLSLPAALAALAERYPGIYLEAA